MSLDLFKKKLRKLKPVFHVTKKGLIRGKCNKCPAVIASGNLKNRNKNVHDYNFLDSLNLCSYDINIIISAADNYIDADSSLWKSEKREAHKLRKFLLSFVR